MSRGATIAGHHDVGVPRSSDVRHETHVRRVQAVRPGPGHLAHVLEMDRDATLRRLDRLAAQFDELIDASVSSNSDDEHDLEGSTTAFERSQLDSLIRQAK